MVFDVKYFILKLVPPSWRLVVAFMVVPVRVPVSVPPVRGK